LVQNTPNALGEVTDQVLGNNIETLHHDFNIRGWALGVNREYLKGNGNNTFGFELAYDQPVSVIPGTTYNASQYNGNISGMIWRSNSDGQKRKYDFTNDNVNRITGAVFTQQSGSVWNNSAGVDYSVDSLQYDANGNILRMKQKGLKGNSSPVIDNLTYTYQNSGNRSERVTDGVKANNYLGDFTDVDNATVVDYVHDANGNLIKDLNKGITSISYNYLNLPEEVVISGKGKISYLYNAAGSRLRKTVVDNTASPVKTTVTDYLAGAQFMQDSLMMIAHEEVRTRVVYKTGRPLAFVQDYFIKDHLGNVRKVLTSKTDTSVYALTMELAARSVESALFANVDATQKKIAELPGYPTDNSTNPNAYVALTNANSGQKIGPSKVLRVMAGDTIRINATAVYRSNAANNSYASPEDMVNAITNIFSSSAIADGIHNAGGIGSPINSGLSSSVYTALKQKDNNNQNQSNKPKAYLNFASFDDQFALIDENSGVRQVQGDANVLQDLVVNSFVVSKTGFLYIYTSNESAEDVLFDNLVVVHNSGRLLEETHYYPFGLTMEGISSSALKGTNYLENRKGYNGNELQTKEFGDGSGLELYDFNARIYDQQIGRFMQIDPWVELGNHELLTPYQFSYNNPIRYSDPDGKCPCLLPVIAALLEGGTTILAGTAAATVTVVAANEISKTKKIDVDLSEFSGAGAGAGYGVTMIPSSLNVTEAYLNRSAAMRGELAPPPSSMPVAIRGRLDAPAGSKPENYVMTQGSGQGRGKNNRKPDPEATGDHSVSSDRGSTTFEKNDKNPKGFQEKKRVDTKGAADNGVPTPHVHENGKVRPAELDEIPKSDLSKNKPNKK
jgi:RHS repeat-associated protein